MNFTVIFPTATFETLLQRTQISQDARSELADIYAQHDRVYHGTYHLTFLWHCHEALWTEADAEGFNFDHARIANAIACHDVIYEPKSKVNELRSSNWWILHAREKSRIINPASDADILWVRNAIEATADHFTARYRPVDDQMLLQWFLGLDLLPLAAPWDMFYLNQLQIRAEYRHLSEKEWNEGRSKFLFHALQSPIIYKHPFLHRLYEADARANMQRAYDEVSDWLSAANLDLPSEDR